MAFGDPGANMLAEAIEMLREADRMHRQFFRVVLGGGTPAWEPPVDIVETDHALEIRVALPGVCEEDMQVTSDGKGLHVVGMRPLNAARGDVIHRLEIPYGRFERRIELPAGRYELTQRTLRDGCLVVSLRRLA
jgi:HSP20 family molecular chaperone IbpA